MGFRMLLITISIFIGLFSLPFNANADLISYQFSGHMTHSEFYIGMMNLPPSDLGIHVGDRFSGIFSYDTSAAPNVQGGNTYYNYNGSNGNFHLAVSLNTDIYREALEQGQIADVNINPNYTSPPPSFTINPIYWGSGTLNINTSSSPYNGWGLNFYDNSGTYIFGNGLPSELPNLSSWDNAAFWFGFDWLGGGYGMATGSLDTLTPIPEPTTLLLLGSGLVGLIGFRKRFKNIMFYSNLE